jgi:hypothetical protein
MAQGNEAAVENSSENRQAFVDTRKLRDALDRGQVFAPRGVEPEKVATFGLDVDRMCQKAAVRERFGSLGPKAFDISILDQLGPTAKAVIHSRIALREQTAVTNDAKLPLDLAEKAFKVREAMLDLAAYHLKSDPPGAARVADIRLGTGYFDLARDLERLANLYEEKRPILSKDPYFDAGHIQQARELVKQIRAELGAGEATRQNEALDDASRAWTVFVQTYEEIAAAGRFLWRKEGGDEMFPSLFAFKVSRSRPSAKQNPAATSSTPAAPDRVD